MRTYTASHSSCMPLRPSSLSDLSSQEHSRKCPFSERLAFHNILQRLSNVLAQPPLVQPESLNTSQSLSTSTRVKRAAHPRALLNSISPSTPPSYARVLFAILLTQRARQRMRHCILPIAQGFKGVCSGVATKKGHHPMPRSPRSLPA